MVSDIEQSKGLSEQGAAADNGQTTEFCVDQFSLTSAAIYQIGPGVAMAVVYAALAYLMFRLNLPNLFALVLTLILVEVPLCWAIIYHHTRKTNDGTFSFSAAFPWSAKIPWWHYLLIGVPLIILSSLVIVGLGPLIETPIRDNFFSWVPSWFVMSQDPAIFTTVSRELLLLMWGVMGIGMVLMGGFTQELYSRGFLLPRMSKIGSLAPLYNALFFAIFHFIAPWSWLPFFLMTLPWAYLVWWRKSVKIGLFIHVGMLFLQWFGMTLMVFGVVDLGA